MNATRTNICLIVCAVLSCAATALALFAALVTLFPNMDRHSVVGHITIVDATENPVVQIGPELSTNGTIEVRGEDGQWETVQLIPAKRP